MVTPTLKKQSGTVDRSAEGSSNSPTKPEHHRRTLDFARAVSPLSDRFRFQVMSSTFELLALHSVGRCAPSRLAFGSVCAFAFCAVMLPGRFVRSFWLWLLRVLF